jgi:hypothetical protein
MRQKKQHKKWIFEKFKGNTAIYQICPYCNFRHNASKTEVTIEEDGHRKMNTYIAYQYLYCPMCGKYLYDKSKNINVIWNERRIEEILEEENGCD